MRPLSLYPAPLSLYPRLDRSPLFPLFPVPPCSPLFPGVRFTFVTNKLVDRTRPVSYPQYSVMGTTGQSVYFVIHTRYPVVYNTLRVPYTPARAVTVPRPMAGNTVYINSIGGL